MIIRINNDTFLAQFSLTYIVYRIGYTKKKKKSTNDNFINEIPITSITDLIKYYFLHLIKPTMTFRHYSGARTEDRLENTPLTKVYTNPFFFFYYSYVLTFLSFPVTPIRQ